jgi:hypothetical protein
VASRAPSWSTAFCWIGAAVDAVAAAALLSPRLSARLLGVEAEVTPALLYAMRTGAALMLGWTCLLVWASRRPVERGGVIVLTIVPVVAGLALTEVLAVREGFVPAANVAPLLVMQALLAGFGAVSYHRDRGAGS